MSRDLRDIAAELIQITQEQWNMFTETLEKDGVLWTYEAYMRFQSGELPLLSERSIHTLIDNLKCGKFCDPNTLARLEKLASVILYTSQSIAALITSEASKPIPESKAEIELAIRYINSYLEGARRLSSTNIELENKEASCRIVYEPVGKSALITPWNFPFLMLVRKAIPALIAGCPVIIKPAPETPHTALFFQSLLTSCGFGTDECVVCIAEESLFGKVVAERSDVRKISFTGSTEVGKLLYRACANTLKRLTMELGGNAPLIICESADPDKFLKWLKFSKFRNCGQACTAANRVLVHSKRFKEVLAHYQDIVSGIRVGDCFTSNVDISNMIRNEPMKRIQEILQDAKEKGAKTFPLDPKFDVLPTPTVVWDAPTSARIFKEELFAPVVGIFQADSDDELIDLANQTEYGLSAYLFTEERAEELAARLDFEMVGINTGFVSYPEFPFGGRKFSGFGKEGGGEAGILEFANAKNLVIPKA